MNIKYELYGCQPLCKFFLYFLMLTNIQKKLFTNFVTPHKQYSGLKFI